VQALGFQAVEMGKGVEFQDKQLVAGDAYYNMEARPAPNEDLADGDSG
jgi:predicted lysophospholipase L1 biosynthesis ABC-type transport system permease subunit